MLIAFGAAAIAAVFATGLVFLLRHALSVPAIQ